MLRRLSLLERVAADPTAQEIERERCKRDVIHWFDNWVWTYDPRAASETPKRPSYMPFNLFPRQREMVQFLDARLLACEDGAIEKSRDIGFTWCSAGYALHRWLFVDGFKTTFGSRKEEYVDRLGDPDSIFEKIRLILYRLPEWMRPEGFSPAKDDNHLRILNPTNGNVIRGEAGDQMGRGGRSTLYFIDEAAFVERAEKVDAATSANTDVRIWGSTVNGVGNLFYRKTHGQLRADQVFRFHWSDDPRKTPEWAEKKQREIDEVSWAAEYDIDYAASIEGLCIPAKWVLAAQSIADRVKLEPAVSGVGGLDVGAGGDKSVYIARFGSIVHMPISWGDPDTIETAHRGLDEAEASAERRSDGQVCSVKVMNFDSIGVGAGVLAALARSQRDGLITNGINVGESPTETRWKDGETSKEKFVNLKAELWSLARERFKNTYEMMLFLDGKKGGQEHDPSDLISIPKASSSPQAAVLASELSSPKQFRNENGKIMIEKKADLKKRVGFSPDHAEALILTFMPPPRRMPSFAGYKSRTR